MVLSTITKICVLTSWTSWIRTSISGSERSVGIPRMAISLPRQQERSLDVLQRGIKRLHTCGDHIACQKWRSIGGQSATINWRALSGGQIACRKQRSFGVSEAAINWRGDCDN